MQTERKRVLLFLLRCSLFYANIGILSYFCKTDVSKKSAHEILCFAKKDYICKLVNIFITNKKIDMNRLVLSIIVIFTGCISCCGQQKFRTVEACEFEHYIASDSVQTVDVRTADEYKEGHIDAKGVINIDAKDADFMKTAAGKLDKSRPVAVYCRGGRRSAEAARILSEAGYRVIDLKGGILEWQEQGKKTTGQ